MSDQVQVRIKGMVITAAYGTLSDGTILRTGAAFAKHLVEDCNAAEYVVPCHKTGAEADEKPARARRKRAAEQPQAPAVPVSPEVADPVVEQSADAKADQQILQPDQGQAADSDQGESGAANENE